MNIGLMGLPNTGKTTIFNALTKQEAEVTPYAGVRTEPHVAVIEVTDPRLDRLTDLYHPRKTVFTNVNFIDFAGLSEGAARDGSFSANATALMRNTDALALVLRNFPLPGMPSPDPIRELERLEEELSLSDLILVENRLERIDQQFSRGRKTREQEQEQAVLKILHEHLSNARPVSELDLTPDAAKIIRGFRLFSLKPFLAVLNSDESHFEHSPELVAKIRSRHPVLEFAGEFEMELSRLDEEDALLFMEDLGITASARDRLLRLAYLTLGYISFFTVGQDEVRAWNLHGGETALDAAGVIHSDLARGFIRAERFSYEDIIACGSEKIVKEKGRLSLEGKNYIVHDGDILNIRFSV